MSYLLRLTLLLLSLVVHAHAATLYVAKTGNNANSCTAAQSLSTPKLTIQAGVDCLNAGDTLYIRAGTYAETINAGGRTGTASQRITIAGYPGDTRPVVQPPPGTNIYAVSVYSSAVPPTASYITIRDFDIDAINGVLQNGGCFGIYRPHVIVENMYCVNAVRNGGYMGGINADYNSDYLIFRNNHIKDCGRIEPPEETVDTKGVGVYSTTAFGLFEGNLIEGCRGSGFEINYGANHDSIWRNNIIRNIGLTGAWGPDPNTATSPRGFAIGGGGTYLPYGPENNQIYNNVIYSIRGEGSPAGRCFAYWSGHADNFIWHNTCYDADHGVGGTCGTTETIKNNIFAHTTSGTICTGALITNNLVNPSVSATFVNAAGGDFHLKAGSPALDTGTTVAEVTTDYDGQSRPQNALYDIGADEHSLLAPPEPELVLHLAFNEGTGTTADDASLYDIAGTLSGGATWGAGIVGTGSVVLDGLNDLVTIPDGDHLDMTTAFSLAAWVYPVSPLTTWATTLVKNYVYFLYAGTPSPCLGVLGGFVSGTNRSVCHSTPLTVNAWTHLAVTYDGTTLRLYRNNTQVGTPLTVTATMAATSNPLYVGASQFGEHFPGRLDDVRVYNYALTAGEVAGLYALRNPPFAAAAQLGSGRLGNVRLGVSEAPACPGTYCQDFEATETPANWGAGPNYDNTTSPIAGTQDALYAAAQTSSYDPNFNATQLWIAFRVQFSGAVTATQDDFLLFRSAANGTLATASWRTAAGQYRCLPVGGTANDGGSTTSLVTGGHILKVYYSRSTASNGTMRVWKWNSGTSQWDLQCESTNGTDTTLIDNVRLNNETTVSVHIDNFVSSTSDIVTPY